jgi:hypothetical protein
VLAACGDDGGPADVAAPSATQGAAAPGGSPAAVSVIPGPASKYSLLHDDVGRGYLTDIPGTYVLEIENYAANKMLFPSESEGKKLLTSWHYAGGYETALIPEGQDVALLNGGYAIYQEVHLFDDAAGATEFFAYLDKRLQSNTVHTPTVRIGDETAVYSRVEGKIRGSSIDRALHQVVFRRGNFVAIVLTIGADSFMKPDIPLSLARMIDEKTQGTRIAIEPTPTSNWTPPVFNQRTPTPPAATPTAGN